MIKLSKDLTLVLLRANGSPRTFNLPIPRLKRSLMLISGLFAFLAFSSTIFSGLYVYENYIAKRPPLLTSEDAAKLESIKGLTSEINTLQANLEKRKKLGSSVTTVHSADTVPLSLFSAMSTQVDNSAVQINNPSIRRSESDSSIDLKFELQNKFPNKQRVRGYIIVLAKTPDQIHVYPERAFSIDEDVLLNYNQGETFGISRFRAASAKFTNIDAKRGDLSFHILIFSYTGKILNSLHVKEGM